MAPKLLAWVEHLQDCEPCRTMSKPEVHKASDLCPVGYRLYRIALEESYPGQSWARFLS